MIENLHFVKELGLQSQRALEAGDLREFARLMDVHWQRKKTAQRRMSNPKINEWYDLAMASGALGGKLIGAGGGGFLMFYATTRPGSATLCSRPGSRKSAFVSISKARNWSSRERAARHAHCHSCGRTRHTIAAHHGKNPQITRARRGQTVSGASAELLHARGIRRAVLCLGYLGEMIQRDFGDGHAFGLRLDYSFDGPKPLGTGGAIKHALPLLGDEFFVLYGIRICRLSTVPSRNFSGIAASSG